MNDVLIIDSHTAGEPTRVVISGGPELGRDSLAARREILRAEHDRFRSAVVNEPRGSDVAVGALLVEPVDPTCVAGIIFFDNVTYLGMCGHGTIGVVATLAHLGRITPGTHRLETPVGIITATLHDDGRVSIQNIPCRRKAKDVRIGGVTGDVAFGGNEFFIVADHGLDVVLGNVEELTRAAWRLRGQINASGFPEVDHIVLEGRPDDGANVRGFVLCPGKAYDRSPCGTGTSAKLACLAADGRLAPGDPWVQESILGTRFEGRYQWADETKSAIVPTITGQAYINAECRLIFEERDPFRWGIRPQ